MVNGRQGDRDLLWKLNAFVSKHKPTTAGNGLTNAKD
jgi:hypothetical protein